MNNLQSPGLSEASRDSIVSAYLHRTGKKITILILALILIIFMLGVSLSLGVMSLPLSEVYSAIASRFFSSIEVSKQAYTIVWNIRLPRALTAIFAGMGLALAGAVMQGLLHNPMASPFTLGISAGAGLGAAIAIIYGAGVFIWGRYHVVANAFIFAMIVSGLILLIARAKGSNPRSLILAGIAIMYLSNAVMTSILYFTDAFATREVMFWLVGSLGKADWISFKWITIVFIAVFTVILVCSADLNRLMLGDDAAVSLGVSVKRLRTILMISTSLLVGCIVSFIGGIGFLGLVAPHLARMLIGSDNRFTMPGSALIGALLLLSADTLALNAFSPIVMPVGVITSFIGSPLFIFLIISHKRYLK